MNLFTVFLIVIESGNPSVFFTVFDFVSEPNQENSKDKIEDNIKEIIYWIVIRFLIQFSAQNI